MTKSRKIKDQENLLRRSKLLKTEGAEVIKAFSELMNRNKIPFWLEFGTLLGFYRDRDFISHDFDIDFGTYIENHDRIRKTLTDAGFKLVRLYTDNGGGIEECYKFKNSSFDVFYFRRDEEGMHCTSYKRAPKSWIRSILNRRKYIVKELSFPDTGLVAARFKDADIFVPSACEAHLKAHYGENYMIPDPDFNSETAPNVRYFPLEERYAVGRRLGKK